MSGDSSAHSDEGPIGRGGRPGGPTNPDPVDPELEPGGRPGVRALAAVAVGGALGTWLRAALTLPHPPPAGAFPWAVLAVNVVGSAALGLGVETVPVWLPRWHSFRPLFGAGLCGGLTTFSTLTAGADVIVYHGRYGTALAYLGLSLALGLVAAAGGVALGRGAARYRR